MAYYQGYSHQNPAYQGTHEKAYRDTGVNMNNVAMVPEAPRYSWCTAGWSLFSVWCCGLWGMCCGLLGLLFSMWSYTDHKAGDFERSAHKKRWAIACVVLALFLGLCSIIAVILLIVAFNTEVCDYIKTQNLEGFDQICADITKINV